MKKIIFGVFPKEVISQLQTVQNAEIFHDTDMYKNLKHVFSITKDVTVNSFVAVLEYAGLPFKMATHYKDQIKEKSKSVIAVIVPLHMEEKTRSLFKQFQAESISTINCK